MKKILFIVIVALMLSIFVSCKENNTWKEHYGTPEKFAEQLITEDCCYIYPYDDSEKKIKDTGLEIKALLEEIKYSEKLTSKDSKGKFFTYERFISHATSGPNYCTMKIYENGIIVIDYKASLARHKFVYFKMNAEDAKVIIEKVFEKFPNEG